MYSTRLRLVGVSASVLLSWGVGLTAGVVFASPLDVIDAVYRSDTPFPQYMPLWREGWKWTDETGQRVRHAYEGMPLGGYVHVYVRNTTGAPVDVTDVLVDGVSLAEGVATEGPDAERKGKFASSILFSKLPADQVGILTSAGEPVWWKVDPLPVPAGGMAEVTIRLRRDPKPGTLQIRPVVGQAGPAAAVRVGEDRPQIRSISFSPGMDKVFLYLRHMKSTKGAPSRILFDGRDVTGRASIRFDDSLEINPVIVTLDKPAREPEFHCFQVVYPDGMTATASVRAWEPDFRYGMWGIPKEGDTPEERARIYVERLARHNINTIMSHYGSDVRQFAASEEGAKLCASLGIRIMDHSYGAFDDPLYYYLPDEPDAHDFGSRSIESPGKRLGSLAQWVLARGRELRSRDPDTLLLCNVDNTYKPEQWYVYAQLPDVISADPYYPEQLRSVYRFDPMVLGAYTKPTYVYAVGEIYGLAGAPKPMHIILHTCRFDMPEYPFRAPTPEEKRIEVYYALASGTKGISYWWYTPTKDRYYGCGGTSPDMVSLMTEIGLLGAEVRTVGPVISRSCPVALPIEAPRKLWARSLVAAPDCVILVIVNDNIACDRAGFVANPIENAYARVRLPAWLEPRDVFEITCEGTRNASWNSTAAGVSIDLGSVDLTRLIVISSNDGLRSQLQEQHDRQFASHVIELLAAKTRITNTKDAGQ